MRRRYIILIPLLLGFFVAQIVQAATTPPGSENDPIVTQKYVYDKLEPLRVELAALEEEKIKLEVELNKVFNDISPEHWAYDSVMFMVEKNIIKGMGDGNFAPDNPTTRAQLAVMLVNALELPTDGIKAEFSDVLESHWAYGHIAAAQQAGIIRGNDGKFRPNDKVTRAEMAAMLVKAFELERLDKAEDFSDLQQDYWAYDVIMRVADNGISKGYPDGTFKPKKEVKRSEVCVFLALSIDPSRR